MKQWGAETPEQTILCAPFLPTLFLRDETLIIPLICPGRFNLVIVLFVFVFGGDHHFDRVTS